MRIMILSLLLLLVCVTNHCLASSECKTTQEGTEYTGTLSKTSCKQWTDFYMDHGDTDFPDGSRSAAANYCRNPDNDLKGPWCYTGNGGLREYCDVPFCPAAASVECRAEDATIQIRLTEIPSTFTAENLILGDDCTGVKNDTTSILSFETPLEGCNSTLSFDENFLTFHFFIRSKHDKTIVREELNLTVSCVYPRSELVASTNVAPDLVTSDDHIQQTGAFQFYFTLYDVEASAEYTAGDVIPTNKEVRAKISLTAPRLIHLSVDECFAQPINVTQNLTHTIIHAGNTQGNAGCFFDDKASFNTYNNYSYSFDFTMFAFTMYPEAGIVFTCKVNVFDGIKEAGMWPVPENACSPLDIMGRKKRSVRSAGLEVTSPVVYMQP